MRWRHWIHPDDNFYTTPLIKTDENTKRSRKHGAEIVRQKSTGGSVRRDSTDFENVDREGTFTEACCRAWAQEVLDGGAGGGDWEGGWEVSELVAESTETFAQYSFRLARESRLRKEADAKEAIERKRQRKARQHEIKPELLELVGITKEYLQKTEKAKAEKAIELQRRRVSGVCVCCGDDRDIKCNNHCKQCWNELKNGIVEIPVISPRQINSAMCRVIRKASAMS